MWLTIPAKHTQTRQQQHASPCLPSMEFCQRHASTCTSARGQGSSTATCCLDCCSASSSTTHQWLQQLVKIICSGEFDLQLAIKPRWAGCCCCRCCVGAAASMQSRSLCTKYCNCDAWFVAAIDAYVGLRVSTRTKTSSFSSFRAANRLRDHC
jgi:hypothetical protein